MTSDTDVRVRDPVPEEGFLCVANFDSDVGYAWWLMESFWIVLAHEYDSRYRVRLAYPSISNIPKAIQSSGLDIHCEDFSRVGPISLLRQIAFLRRHHVRVMYFSDHPAIHWKYLFYRLAGVTHVVIHDHSPGLRSVSSGLRKRLKQSWARLPMIVADMAIGATEFVRSRLVLANCLPDDRCMAANNGLPGVRSGDIERDPFEEFAIPHGRKIVVTAARANPVKRIDDALQIVATLLQSSETDNVHYLFFGDGPDLPRLNRQVIDLGIDKNVTFAGNVLGPEAYYRSCHIGLHPSRAEVGYSLAILEYMRAGLPVVVPDNPSVCGATTHGTDGLIYAENDLDDAVDKVEQILCDDGLRQRMADSAREKMVAGYRLETTHAELLAAFAKTLGRGS